MKKLLLGAVMCLCIQYCYASSSKLENASSQSAKLENAGMNVYEAIRADNAFTRQKLERIRQLPAYANERKSMETEIDNSPTMKALINSIVNRIGNNLLKDDTRNKILEDMLKNRTSKKTLEENPENGIGTKIFIDSSGNMVSEDSSGNRIFKNSFGNRIFNGEYRSLRHFIDSLWQEIRYYLREDSDRMSDGGQKLFSDGRLNIQSMVTTLSMYCENKLKPKLVDIRECVDNILNITRSASAETVIWDSLTQEEEIRICACLDALLFKVLGIQPTDKVLDTIENSGFGLEEGYSICGYSKEDYNNGIHSSDQIDENLKWRDEINSKLKEGDFFERVANSGNTPQIKINM
ncbi:MAG: hypothetical protein LBG13_02985 [Holosporales bacterium]|jgi:hypothetical protein|nr:hypothetical protein [Holosporales bacterium]